MEKPIRDPSIPYIGPIYGSKFTPGRMVRIQGLTPGAAYRFNIHLQCGSKITPRDDVAIQISVRLLEGYIIINSLQNGIWDEEQRGTAMPIKRANKFEIIVMCDFSQYKVAVNGQHFCEFPQRIHYDRITHLAIDGDVAIMEITYESAGGDGGASGSGVAALSGPNRLSSNEKDTDFEMVDATPTSTIRSLPPSYGDAVPNNQTQPGIQPLNTTPYTVGTSYSTGVAYPATGTVYPGTTYPISGVGYPGGAYPPQGTVYQAGTPVMLPPAPGQPIPLNFSRPLQRNHWQKFLLIGVLSVFIFFVIIVVIVSSVV